MNLLPLLLAGCSRSEQAEPLVIPIESPTGIGTETLQQPEGGWPDEVVVQLKVTRLESLGLSCGPTTFQLEGAITDSPRWHWAVGGDQLRRAAAVRWEKNFWFYITLPEEALAGCQSPIQISWIDAYRQ